MSKYMGFGKYEPTRWQRFKRRFPSVRIRYNRDDETWVVRRRWRNGSTCEARSYSLLWAVRRARKGGASLWMDFTSANFTTGGPTHTHTARMEKKPDA